MDQLVDTFLPVCSTDPRAVLPISWLLFILPAYSPIHHHPTWTSQNQHEHGDFEKTSHDLLADMEHELRVHGHPAGICPAEQQREWYTEKLRRRDRTTVVVLAGRTGGRYDRSTHCRPLQRPYLEPAGKEEAVLSFRRYPFVNRAYPYAECLDTG